MIYVRKRDGWRWWFVSAFGWQPFKRFNHGGWVCLNRQWLKHHG